MFDIAINSPTLIVLTIIYVITSSITTFDTRLIQARLHSEIPLNHPMLPKWIGLVWWLHWGIFISLLFLNWKYAILLFMIKFILKVLPVLEIIGNILMSPFRPRKKIQNKQRKFSLKSNISDEELGKEVRELNEREKNNPEQSKKISSG